MAFDYIKTLMAPIEEQYTARNWTTSLSGDEVRQGCDHRAMLQLIEGLNYCLSMPRRTLFSAAIPSSESIETNGASFQYYGESFVNNERHVIMTALVGPPDSANNATWRQLPTANTYVNDEDHYGQIIQNNIAQSDHLIASFFDAIYVYRNSSLGGDYVDGFEQLNSARLLGAFASTVSAHFMSPTVSDYIEDKRIYTGQPITYETVDAMRQHMHNLFTYKEQPMVYNWAALGNSVEPAAPEQGNCQGVYINSSSIVNIIDQNITSRTATSPGNYTSATYAGRGNIGSLAGRQIPCRAAVLAKCVASEGGANVYFLGPLNNLAIPITANAGLAWHTSDSTVYLDSASSDSNMGELTANKIDCLAAVQNVGDRLYIYSARSWISW